MNKLARSFSLIAAGIALMASSFLLPSSEVRMYLQGGGELLFSVGVLVTALEVAFGS